MPLPGDNYYQRRNNLFSKMNTFCFRFANVQFSKKKQELPVFWYSQSSYLFYTRWSKMDKINWSEAALETYFLGQKHLCFRCPDKQIRSFLWFRLYYLLSSHYLKLHKLSWGPGGKNLQNIACSAPRQCTN